MASGPASSVSEPAEIDDYASVDDGPQIELKIKGSRFLGRALQLPSGVEPSGRLDPIVRAHHAARHHCWASRVGPPGEVVERSDDDGEPSGTAGRPILRQISGRSLHDVMVVVTRYFGGTKLGTGGLARAYADAAGSALDAARPRLICIDRVLIVEFVFEDLGALELALAREGDGVRRVEREYDPRPRMTVVVRPSRASRIAGNVVEATAGRATVRQI